MIPIVPERLPELWQTGKLHLDPRPIACVPRRIFIGVVAVTVVTGELFLVSLGVVTWNMLAGVRNRIASGA